jgi:hypothetical protein
VTGLETAGTRRTASFLVVACVARTTSPIQHQSWAFLLLNTVSGKTYLLFGENSLMENWLAESSASDL